MKIEVILSNLPKICSQWFNQQYGSIGSDNGLAPIRRQAIIWINDGLVDGHVRH